MFVTLEQTKAYRNTTTLIKQTNKFFRMNKYSRSGILLTILSLILLSIVASPCFGQQSPLSFESLKYGDQVELKSGQGSTFLNRQEARNTVKKLITKIDPSNISSIHEGYSEDRASYYGILKLESEMGNRRLFYYCEKKGKDYLITKIRVNRR